MHRKRPQPVLHLLSRPGAFAVVLIALCCSGVPAHAQVSKIHIRNFSQVNPHLFRGGQPEPAGLRELAASKVSLVVDLREPSTQTEVERRLVEGLGMKYLGIPLSSFSAPTSPQMRRILAVLNPDDAGRIFVHCWRGKDRTGTVIACYRIQHDGWKPQKALTEAESHGMSRMERGMRSFILRYTPEDLPATVSALQ